MNIFIDIRQPVVSDVNYLMDIDIKCFENPWTVEKWRAICSDPQIFQLVATYYGSPVGFVIWERTPDVMNILRIGVKPSYRRNGVGEKLLRAVESSAYHLQLFRVTLLVPESLCCPGMPRDVSQWLLHKGARAGSIVKGPCLGYEEDAFLFTLIVKGDL